MLKIGFAEGHKGRVWDHKEKTQLVQILILSDNASIKHLQFVYAENGSFILSERIGDKCIGNKFNTVKLDYPDEFLTSVSGSYSVGIAYDESYERYNTYKLTSISFGTNKCKHGPFGDPGEYSNNFDFQMGQDRAFGGFHGSTTTDGVVETIGVYVKPITARTNLSSAEERGPITARTNLSSAEERGMWEDSSC